MGVDCVVQHDSLEKKPAVASVAGILSLPDRRKVEFIKNDDHPQPSAELQFKSYPPSKGLCHFDLYSAWQSFHAHADNTIHTM